jgi:hypothetical protein
MRIKAVVFPRGFVPFGDWRERVTLRVIDMLGNDPLFIGARLRLAIFLNLNSPVGNRRHNALWRDDDRRNLCHDNRRSGACKAGGLTTDRLTIPADTGHPINRAIDASPDINAAPAVNILAGVIAGGWHFRRRRDLQALG